MAKVSLHIYDVGTNPEIAKLNQYLTAVGTGAFHGAVEIFGKEWSYGFTQNGSGIFPCAPKQCEMHHYRESLDLGTCQKSEKEVNAILEEMKPEWPGTDYDLLRKNCVIFSAAFADKLGVKPVPSWVTNLAGAGATVQQGAMQAATQAQRTAILAKAKAGELDEKYNISGTTQAKVTDMIQQAKALDQQYNLQDKAKQAGATTAQALDKGAAHASKLADHLVFKVSAFAEEHKVKEQIGGLANQAKGKMAQLDEKHHISEQAQVALESTQRTTGCANCTVQ